MTMNIPPFSSVPWASTAKHNMVWSGVSLWSVQVGCPSCAPSQPRALFQPIHWDGMVHGRVGTRGGLAAVLTFLLLPSAITRTSVVYQLCSSQRFNCMDCYTSKTNTATKHGFTILKGKKSILLWQTIEKKATKTNKWKNQTPFPKEWTGAD